MSSTEIFLSVRSGDEVRPLALVVRDPLERLGQLRRNPRLAVVLAVQAVALIVLLASAAPLIFTLPVALTYIAGAALAAAAFARWQPEERTKKNAPASARYPARY